MRDGSGGHCAASLQADRAIGISMNCNVDEWVKRRPPPDATWERINSCRHPAATSGEIQRRPDGIVIGRRSSLRRNSGRSGTAIGERPVTPNVPVWSRKWVLVGP